MRFAYADPPYLGSARKRYGKLHPEAAEWDKPETHQQLIESLDAYDGWALSCSSPSLRVLLPMCPKGVRVLAWVKGFTTFWPNVNPAYAWEPVILKPVRTPPRPTLRDWCSVVSPAQRGGYTGEKPSEFCGWLFAAAGLTPDDELVDLYPGSGAVGRAWDVWRAALRAYEDADKVEVTADVAFERQLRQFDDEPPEPFDSSGRIGVDA